MKWLVNDGTTRADEMMKKLHWSYTHLVEVTRTHHVQCCLFTHLKVMPIRSSSYLKTWNGTILGVDSSASILQALSVRLMPIESSRFFPVTFLYLNACSNVWSCSAKRCLRCSIAWTKTTLASPTYLESSETGRPGAISIRF